MTVALDSLPLIVNLDEFVFGRAPLPVRCGRGVEIGTGTVIPEINFTLPPMEINEDTWDEVRQEYSQTIEGICQRAVELEVPAFLVEFETLPPMTLRPEWGAEICRILLDTLDLFHDRYGLDSALRFTPNDTRDHRRPPILRHGKYWEGMLRSFELGVSEGADLLAIESTGGKDVCDDALMVGDLRTVVFALGVLAPRDMKFLWRQMVAACSAGKTIAAGDTACGFANTAMVLADRKMIPKVFAAVVRVASVPRSLVAVECGARGPSKDCAYEGPYLKAIAGIPISMEGRTSACAHLSHVGNIAQAVCDCWSNESVQMIRLLSGPAPTVSFEQLAYDCRLMNTASSHSRSDARRLRDWLTDSDSGSDPQAYVLRPDVVLRISRDIAEEETPYRRTRAAVRSALDEIRAAVAENRLNLEPREVKWLDRMQADVDSLPDDEETFIEEMIPTVDPNRCLLGEYGLEA
jgi:methanol--5-hydroxybenzimidazolylcobamide Co-methyltransferase